MNFKILQIKILFFSIMFSLLHKWQTTLTYESVTHLFIRQIHIVINDV